MAPSLFMVARLSRAGRWALEPVLDRTTWAGGAVLVGGAVPVLALLALVAVGVVAGAALTPLGLGVPVLAAALVLARSAADVDRRVFAAALGESADLDAEPVGAVGAGAGWRSRARSLVADPRTWRSTAWLAVRAGVGLLAVLGLLGTAVVAVALLAVPFADGYLAFGPTWRSSAGWSSSWTLPVAAGLLVGVAHGFRLLTTAHLRLADTLLGPDPADRLAALQRAVDRADVRERLARDLHDGLGHALTLVVVQAEAAATALADDPDGARRRLGAVTAAARGALDDLDRALAVLHAGAPRSEPGLDDVPALVQAARAAGLDVVLTPPGPGETASSEALVSEAAYRVVQESLTNALRHSGSRVAHVVVGTGPDETRVVVRTPLAPARRPWGRATGRGLTGLEDRVTSTGGRFAAGPAAGEFVVEAVWPRR